MISLSNSRIHYEFTISYANSQWIHYQLREFTLNLLWVHYHLRKITMNWSHYGSIIVSLWIRYLFSFSRTHNEFTIKYSNSRWVRYLFREIPINSLSSSWIRFDFTIEFVNSIIFFAIKLWIHYQLFHYQLREFTINFILVALNSLLIKWIYYESIIFFVVYKFTFFVNKLWFHYPIREFTMSSLSVTQMHHKSIIFFANSFWIDFSPRVYYEFTIFIENSLWIHYLCRVVFIFYENLLWIFYLIRESTLNSLDFSQIYYEFFLYFAN